MSAPPPTTADERIVTLSAGDAVVTVHPDSGGRIGQIMIGEVPLLVDVPAIADRESLRWGSFPMAPWAGRIRNGRFAVDGAAHQLVINHHDGDAGDPDRAHSIHGTVWEKPWSVTEQAGATATLECTLDGALDWPFAGTAHQHLELHADRLVQTLAVRATAEPFPGEIGWHPWFRKPQRLVFNPSLMYRRDAFGIPTGELVAVTDGPWDDCFVNAEPVRLHYDREVAHTVTVISDCDHWVVYDRPAESTCVEPQSGPPDAFNLVHHVVTVDTPLTRTMTIAW